MRPSGLFLNDQHRSRSSSPGCHLFIYLLGKLDESKTHADTAALAVLLCFVKTLHRCHLSGPGGETSQSGNVLPSSIVFFFFFFLHGNYFPRYPCAPCVTRIPRLSRFHRVICFTRPKARLPGVRCFLSLPVYLCLTLFVDHILI